jgi:dTDP-4-amino-4,6-dideoxygalactose transaminase
MIRLSKSTIGEAEKKAVLEILDREYLGMGNEVKEFENMLTGFFDRPVACVNSGTAALHLALQAIGLGPGDEVLVQSLTFIATFQSISATGATPVSCEVDPATITIDLKDAEKKLTDKTRGIMPVHYASGMGPLNDIYAFAKVNGLRVVEDAAHAFGSLYNGKKVGSFGDIACFSFDGIKNITCGEGGAVVTDDGTVLEKVRDARMLAVEKDTEKRFAGQRSWEFDVKDQGWRYHMSNIMAAIGSEQFKRLPHITETRRALALRYVKRLNGIDCIEPIRLDYHNIVPHIFVVKVKNGKRDALRSFLIENNIECGVHYYPNHMLTKYKTPYSLPATEQAYREIFSLPCHLGLTYKDQDYVISKIKEFFHA